MPFDRALAFFTINFLINIDTSVYLYYNGYKRKTLEGGKMKETITHNTIGKIEYFESFWTGKKTLTINDVPLQKISKKDFVLPDGAQLSVGGNYLTGSYLQTAMERIPLTPRVKWYEIVLSVLPFLLILVWGNIPALCQIVPVVGGAISGAISAVFSIVNLFIIKGIKPVWLKILISVGVLAVTYLICFLCGWAILSALT